MFPGNTSLWKIAWLPKKSPKYVPAHIASNYIHNCITLDVKNIPYLKQNFQVTKIAQWLKFANLVTLASSQKQIHTVHTYIRNALWDRQAVNVELSIRPVKPY
jgi:hypothetical protein